MAAGDSPAFTTMSLLGDLARQLMSGGAPGEESQLTPGAKAPGSPNLLQLGIALVNQSGGLDGLITKFQQGGLGDLISSWVGKGGNLPVNAEQIMQVLGRGQVQQIAEETGTDPQTAANGLADILPKLVDQLTPNGESVSGGALQEGLQSLLGGDLKKFFS